MTRLACLFALLLPAALLAAEPKPEVLANLDKNPVAVCTTTDGRTFVATGAGEEGAVFEVKGEKATKLLDLPTPTSMVTFQRWLFVSAADSVHRIDLVTGKSEVWAGPKDFPTKPELLAGITTDEFGSVYVAEANKKGANALYRIGMKFGRPGTPPAKETKKVADLPASGGIPSAYTLETDGLNHVMVLENKGEFLRVNVADGKVTSEGVFKSGMDLCTDTNGRVFVLTTGELYGIPRPGEKPVKIMGELGGGAAEAIAFDEKNRRLLIAGKKQLRAIPAQIPGWEVDETPLSVETELAFADVKWTGWDDGSSTGKTNPLRPLVLTHAGDGSGRTFMATQHGVIHVIEKGAKESKVFLDIQSKVLYKDNENEQGLLGLAFHPDYKKNGEFFVFYTDKNKKLENVVSRFRVNKDDPNKATAISEEELLRVNHKYWNHDGGTVCLGPDGFLYVVLGDGGSANDPDDHGQKTDVLLGKILRIDINGKGENTAYAIPKDNPFVGKKNYRPEIYALGVRNPWRLSFDRKTGQGWFGEVGQNLWEEINLLEKGANYGWRRRESLHPFGTDGVGPKKELTDPIWEYHHDVGKSITGGHVYRGKELPALDGYYLYADYVSGKVWGLKYDDKAKRVIANRPIASKNLPIMSFGEDEAGEAYMMTYSATGKGIYKFKAKK